MTLDGGQAGPSSARRSSWRGIRRGRKNWSWPKDEKAGPTAAEGAICTAVLLGGKHAADLSTCELSSTLPHPAASAGAGQVWGGLIHFWYGSVPSQMCPVHLTPVQRDGKEAGYADRMQLR